MGSRLVLRFALFSAVLCCAIAAASSTGSVATPPIPANAICSASSEERPVSDARLLPVGGYRGPSASHNDEAQRFFEQGLVLGWGFDFAEALRSFRAAVRFDPDCAWCHWGIAWALGPSINHDMRDTDAALARDAIARGRVRVTADSRERAAIDALALRYSGKTDADRSYAAAMLELASRSPSDADLAVLAAEALMNAHAYDYWASDGKPRAWTPGIVTLLERALDVSPEHPGAHHYWIHLFEDSKEPRRALRSADKIGTLAPLVGHLVHMPSHITFRLGRYEDAVRANAAAVKADREYRVLTGASADYSLHNLHFLWAASVWSGDADAAMRAADDLAAAAALSDAGGTRQHFLAAPVITRVRFARSDVPTANAIDTAQPYFAGLTHFARGMSATISGNVVAARAELASLQRARRATRAAQLTVKNRHQGADLLNIAQLQLTSALQGASGNQRRAIATARAAVEAEDRLQADDPPAWVLPSRHLLGSTLLRSGAWSEAAAVYRADLQRYPDNAVALAGLAAAQRRSHDPVTQSRSSARQLALSE